MSSMIKNNNLGLETQDLTSFADRLDSITKHTQDEVMENSEVFGYTILCVWGLPRIN